MTSIKEEKNKKRKSDLDTFFSNDDLKNIGKLLINIYSILNKLN